MAVYLLCAGSTEPTLEDRVKIGFAVDVECRVKDLQAAHWDTLHVIRVWPHGDARDEGWLHRQFPKKRIARDWFWFDPEMLTIGIPGFASTPDPMNILRAKRGMMTRIAETLGISRQAVSMWDKIPAEVVVQVEGVTEIPREQLRPDLYREVAGAA